FEPVLWVQGYAAAPFLEKGTMAEWERLIAYFKHDREEAEETITKGESVVPKEPANKVKDEDVTPPGAVASKDQVPNDPENANLLHRAVRQRDLKTAKKILTRDPAIVDVENTGEKSKRALDLAIECGNREMVKLLLEH